MAKQHPSAFQSTLDDLRETYRDWYPELYRALKRSGQLERVLEGQVRRHFQVLRQCKALGGRPDQCWELAERELVPRQT